MYCENLCMSPLCFCQLYSLYDSQSNKKTLHLYLYWFNQPTNKTDSPKKKNLLKIFFHLFFLVFGYCHSEYLVISIIYHSSFFPKIWLISIFFFISIASYFIRFSKLLSLFQMWMCLCLVCDVCLLIYSTICSFIINDSWYIYLIVYLYVCVCFCLCLVQFNSFHCNIILFPKNKLMC